MAVAIAAGALLAVAGTAGGVAYAGHARSRDEAAVRAIPLYEGNPIVYMDIADRGVPVGRLVIQLRADVTPLAAANFRALCAAPLGYGYKTSALHGLEKGARVFGGDFFGSGEGTYSIYGDGIPDESFALPHAGPGCVGLRRYGPNALSSQFYITLRALPHLDGNSEVVGSMREGWGVLAALDKAGKSNGRFTSEHDYRVAACGELVGYAPGEARVAPPPRPPRGGVAAPAAII